MEYTKGDWKATKSICGDWFIATDETVICREARHFNAHLIAAAPDLYEALSNCKVLIETQFTTLMKSYNYKLILKALAKAEGVQHE